VGLLNFSGTLPVAVVFHWKADSVASSLTNQMVDQAQKVKMFDHTYVVANELVHAFKITALDPAASGTPVATIEREATARQRFFDDKLNAFTTKPVPSAELERLLALGTTAKCSVDLGITFATFFDLLLLHMTRVDGVLRTFGNPSDSDKAAIAASVSTKGVPPKKIRADYKMQSVLVANIPCTCTAQEVRENPKKGGPPAVKLTFELTLKTDSSVQRDVMRRLLAADWTSLAKVKHDPDGRAPFPTNATVWLTNLIAYIITHTDMRRAERIRGEMALRHKGKTGATLANDIRVDIDKHLITGNHFGQDREDLRTEPHQRLCSDVFGTLHRDGFHASPVRFLKRVNERDPKLKLFDLSVEQKAALALQWGVGHCGEHADVSFSIIKDVIDDPANAGGVSFAIRTGNPNVDHDFVIFDLDVATVIHTRTATDNARVKKRKADPGLNQEIDIINLRDAIAKSTRPGFVIDPYIDKTVRGVETKALLAALNDKKRGALVTDFIAFTGIHPKSKIASITVTDLTAATPADRARVHKSV
jgi:hypothetical protein